MKLSPTTVVLALMVAGTIALPISDIHRALYDTTPSHRLEPGHGDYPEPALGERFARASRKATLACVTPDVPKRPRHA